MILDAGAGRLQSLSIYSEMDATFMLCDPQLDVSMLPPKTRRLDVTEVDGPSTVNAMKMLDRNKVKYVICKTTLRSLLSRPGVLKFMEKFSIPVALFSEY